MPQSYGWAQDARVDWYEAWVDLDGVRTKVQAFTMRSMASERGVPSRLFAREAAGVPGGPRAHLRLLWGYSRCLRYDNLASAVRKILRGCRREEAVGVMVFRSHWRSRAEFCTPNEGHEKGGVEGEGGYFRRNHLVPRHSGFDCLTMSRDEFWQVGASKQYRDAAGNTWLA